MAQMMKACPKAKICSDESICSHAIKHPNSSGCSYGMKGYCPKCKSVEKKGTKK